MKSKIVTILISLIMVANIISPIAQNAGEVSLSSNGTGGLANASWPMFHHNLNHTGLSPYDTSSNPGKLKWSFMISDAFRTSPVIGPDGTIYTGSCDNKVYAINPDGTEKWSFTTEDHVHSTPAIGFNGTIYVGSDDNKLYAINPNGFEKWSFTTTKKVDSSPVIGSDGTIYVGSHDNKLYAINPDGTKKWSFQTGSAILFCSPAISLDGTVYIGSQDNKLYAVNPDGTKKWDFVTGNKVLSSPAIGADGTIYVGSTDYKLYAIKPDGSEKWNFTTGHVVRSSPAIGSDGTIYVGSYDNKLYAINLDGTKKWSFNTGNDVISSPAIGSDGTIYVGSDDDKLYAINPNGIEKWSFTTGGYIHSSPAIGSDGTIYIGSSDHKLYAIGTPKPSPIANAGPDQIVNEGDAVQFIGCNSSGSIDGNPPSVDPSVVALWHMDEGSGSTVYDETSNNNDGTISGATWTTSKFGSALKFGDTDLVYEIPASFDDPITTNITVVAWVYWEGPHPGTYSPNSYIFDARDFEGTRGGFILYLDPNGTLVFILLYGNNAGDYQIVQSTCKVPIKKWTHIAGVLDYTNGELRLYINGMEAASVPATEPYNDFGGSHWDAAMGNNRYAPGDKQWAPFNGIIDEVVIYNRALTAQELPSTPTKIISYKWDFDDSDGINWDNPDATGPTPTHVYGDNGVYTVTLKITDETSATATNTCNITVLNVAPIVDLKAPHSKGEGSPIMFNSTTTDPGSDDLTFTWNWGDGTTTTTTYFNDGIGLEPFYDPSVNEIKSPWGIYPFNVTDTVNHTYGDNGIYTITLTVEDNDNGTTVIIKNVTVNNVAPNITLLIVPSDYEGSQLIFEAKATDPGSDDLTFSWEFEYGPTIENIYYNDGVNPEPIYDPNTNEVKSPGGTSPFNVSDTVTHTYGDNYDYFLALRVKDDDDGMTVINTTIAVDNIAPSITKFAIPLGIFEGSKATFQAAAKDLGSDDLTFTWEFEQGPSITNTYYNDGMSPDPYPSPWGNFSFIAQDTVDHIYGDNGKFSVMLTVTDDDNGTTTFNTTIIVNNVAPKVDALPNATIDEGGTVTLMGHATDPGSDDLIFTWSWEYASWGDKTTIYYNDGLGPDPFPSPTINPRNVTEDATCQYGDNGIFKVTLTVVDDDGGLTMVTTNVTVNNVNPTVSIESVTMDVEVGLRVAGRKYNNVSMMLYEDGNPIGNVSIERLPGSPNDQMAWIPVTLDMTKTYNTTVTYNPEDPPDIGGNPVWIYIKSQNDSIKKIHHTFNVQQSKKRDSDHWNHVEPWEVDINAHLIGHAFEITSHITDPGSDDETLTYTYGSQIVTVTYLNDPPNPDPYLSPEINPRDIMNTTILVYEGPGTITLIVKDDDNLRLGNGQDTDFFDVA